MEGTKVYLVGAGPGDPGLLTLKAKDLLQRASVVVYDALVSPVILSMVRRGAEMIYVGKRAGHHAMKQSEINETLLRVARQHGGTIVRIKGGDPFVFGRGGEEMQALYEADIPYEVVPGVTAGVAAPAYCGIPVTHRSISRSITLITAFSEEGGVPELDWEALARLQGTLVFYMSMRVVSLIAQKLLSYGMRPTTPAAIISRATLPEQQLYISTLADYADESHTYEAYTPGLWVVGDVVDFAHTYQWWQEELPLRGQRILVTRAEAQASKLVTLLEERGAVAKLLPTIEIAPLEGWEQDDTLWCKPQEGSWLVFTSVNGVHQYMGGLRRRGLDMRSLFGYKIAAIGPATSEALQQYALQPDLMPEGDYTARGLATALHRSSESDTFCTNVLLPTSRLSSGELRELLQGWGTAVRELPVYDNVPIGYSREEVEALLDDRLDCITFCSSSAVHHFFALIDKLGLRDRLRDVALAVIGPVTADALRSYGLEAGIQPQRATLPDLVKAIESLSH